MNRKIVAVADFGHLKVFRLEESENFSRPRLELLDEWETNVSHHLREEVSDQAGRYRKGTTFGGPSDLSDGEQHNLDLERRRRAVKGIAKHITEILKREQADGWFFAAANDVNHAVLDELDASVRGRIEKNVTANMARLDPDRLIAHFCE